MSVDDRLLNLLGNYFVSERLHSKGWVFAQFVEEYKLGYIEEIKKRPARTGQQKKKIKIQSLYDSQSWRL